MRHANRGFTLVELMVALALGLVTALAALQMLSTFLASERRITGRNEGLVNAAIGLTALQDEIRMAGAALSTPLGRLCSNGANLHFNGTVLDGAALAAVRIIDGGAGPDSIEVVRSSADSGGVPLTILAEMPSPDSPVSIDSRYGLNSGDVVILGSADGQSTCTVTQLTAAPEPEGSGWRLPRSTSSPYNPASPAASFNQPTVYGPQDIVVNLGPDPAWRMGLACSDLSLPSASNNCELIGYAGYGAPAPLRIEDGESLASGVFDLQAQYGIADTGSTNVNAWVDATGLWAAPSVEETHRIRALRVAIVTRDAARDATRSTSSLVLWTQADGTQRTRTLSGDEHDFRYHVRTAVVPLINVAWSPQ